MSYPSHAYCLALCYQRTDDPYRALHWYTKALELDPTYPEALNNVAAVHYELSGSFNEAIPYLIRAVELSNEAINRSMAVIYRNLWMHYNSILEHEKANYFQKLHLRCVGLDGLASFLDDN